MKKWNTPAVAELSIEETANGLFPFYVESYVLVNDSLTCDNNKGDDSNTPENVAS